MSIQIEYNLTGTAVPDYAMYTELGNVDTISVLS